MTGGAYEPPRPPETNYAASVSLHAYARAGGRDEPIRDAIRALAAWGAPFIAQKSHPELLFEWIKQNPGKIGKIE